MTNEELHFLGIKVVYKDLVDKGYNVMNVRKEFNINPQILARNKNGQYVLVVVKTACYPHMGLLVPDVAANVRHLAQKHQAICYFASVGIANANSETEEEMSKPVLGGEYYINYDGLRPLPSF
ncbi:MAG: hypothetical protein QM786_00875 [Breznakibacter sp.]